MASSAKAGMAAGGSRSGAAPGRRSRSRLAGPGLAGLWLAGSLLLTACEPTVQRHGHVWFDTPEETIQPGVDTRRSLSRRLGTPTAVGLERGDPWIYISQTEEKRGARTPELMDHRVVLVRFDGEDRVVSVEELGAEDRLEIDYATRATPNRGTDFNILQQFLGNVGRFETQ